MPIRERGVHGPSQTHRSLLVRDSYEKLRHIGEGGQGKLWLVKRKSDRKVLVRKEQKRFHMQGPVPCEMYIFESVLTRHPSIIEFDHANYNSDNGSLVLYFEYCEGGDLASLIPKRGQRGVSEDFLWHCFIQLADAIAFLHYGYNRFAADPHTPPRNWRRVMHCDIKPANVFLRRRITARDPLPRIVLGDFGLATLSEEVCDGSGTYEWIGPEVPRMSKQNDVWAIGAIIHALAHGEGPVAESPPRGWKGGWDSWVMDPKARNPRPLSRAYSSALNTNMMDCLVRDPKKRVNSRQLAMNLVAEQPGRRR